MRRFVPFLPKRPQVAVIRLQGMIAASGGASRLNDAALEPVIEAAFAAKPVAVALAINSPGGSAVQSALIGARLRRLADKHSVPLLAFVEDVAASGGYWLASSADEIFVDANSIVGSIGVIAASFGLHDLIARYGIERRVHTAGVSKSQLDPFRPENPDDVARLRALLDQIHQNFIAQVKDRRGAKLADRDLFTGEFWTGAQAVELGLADALGHMVPVLQARFGDKVRLRRYGPRRPVLARFGLSVMSDALALSEERALFARYGV